MEDIFSAVREQVPSTLGPNAWYLIVVSHPTPHITFLRKCYFFPLILKQASALVACGKPEEIGKLASYIYNRPNIATASERATVSKRLRDVLMKEWTLVGIPLVITAVASLATAEENLGFDNELSDKW